MAGPPISLLLLLLLLSLLGACRSGSGRGFLRTPEPVAGVPGRTAHALSDSVEQVLARALADSAFPAAFAVIGTHAGVVTEHAVGAIDWAGSPRPDARTLWDMASLTKVVATTTAVMQLVEQGRVVLDAPVQRYLPEWQGPGKDQVTVRHLLAHASGLPSWRPLYKEATDPAAARALALATPLDTVPAVRMVYSDLGAITLGAIVERTSGETLDAYLAKHVFGPLGMRDTGFRPATGELPRIAPTEYDPWRQRKVRGEVHDENAYALGGVSGHAGLFSTAADLTRFARMYLNGGTLDSVRIVDPATIAAFTAIQDPSISFRALGWEKPSGTNSAGTWMSPAAFGHTGFTGTSIWIDPERDIFVILLTNRVNPSRQNTRIGRVRTALADAVIATLESGVGATSTAKGQP